MKIRIAARAVVLSALLATALSGCGDARRALGWEKSAPDEFAVVSRAPLSLPPDYDLRPPQPGAARPQEGSSRDQARDVLLGGRNTPSRFALDHRGRSPGEMAILKKAGADQANPEIRSVVNQETTALADADRSFTERLMFWRAPEKPGTVVDASKETQRLRENQALGKSITEGDTPVIQRKKKALLEGIF